MMLPIELTTKRQAHLWGNRLRLVGRVGTIVLLIVFGIQLLSLYRFLLHGPSESPELRADSSAEELLLPIGLAEGAWQIGDVTWTVQIATLNDHELLARLEVIPSGSSECPNDLHEQALLLLVRQWLGPPESHRGMQIYRYDSVDEHVRVYCRLEQGRERPLAVRIATRQEGHWKLAEITPLQGKYTATAGFGFDWPDGVQRLAIRRDKQGQWLGELVRGNVTPDDLETYWIRKGWIVARIYQGLVLRRDREVIQLWLPPVAKEGQQLILAGRQVEARLSGAGQ